VSGSSTKPGEFARIARLRRLLGEPPADVPVGIGDDAAVLRLAGAHESLVWTVDAQVEGRHFVRGKLSWADIAFRAYMAAASDLAAMGSAPFCALASWILPVDLDDEAFDELARGTRAAAGIVGAAVVGGNLSAGGEISLSTTLLGRTDRPMLRSGGRAGDGLWMAGPVGLAAVGLRGVLEGRRDLPPECDRAFRRPAARIAEGLRARDVATAAIDVSDGLAQDVGHLAQDSGRGFVLEESALLAAGGDALLRGATVLGADPLDLALYGGEDYALVVASAEPIEGFVRIGELTEGAGLSQEEPRGRLRRVDGAVSLLVARGFDHFRV
jgi:thiamine-monophosphate kinase